MILGKTYVLNTSHLFNRILNRHENVNLMADRLHMFFCLVQKYTTINMKFVRIYQICQWSQKCVKTSLKVKDIEWGFLTSEFHFLLD